MKLLLTLLMSGVTGFVVAAGVRDEKPKTGQTPKKPAVKKKKSIRPKNSKLTHFMRGKLTASQSVLDGLVTEDFKKIEKGGLKLLVMSKAADWQVFKTGTYAQYSAEFQRTTDRLVKMAKKKQLDSAALSYMHVTMTCINCHKYVKKERLARGEPVPPGLRRLALSPRHSFGGEQ